MRNSAQDILQHYCEKTYSENLKIRRAFKGIYFNLHRILESYLQHFHQVDVQPCLEFFLGQRAPNYHSLKNTISILGYTKGNLLVISTCQSWIYPFGPSRVNPSFSLFKVLVFKVLTSSAGILKTCDIKFPVLGCLCEGKCLISKCKANHC